MADAWLRRERERRQCTFNRRERLKLKKETLCAIQKKQVNIKMNVYRRDKGEMGRLQPSHQPNASLVLL